MNLPSHIESILFVASKPVSRKAIVKATGKQPADIDDAIETLKLKYQKDTSGIVILEEGDEVQMASNPDNVLVIDGFVKDEAAGELTKAQLETLTVIAYRGPMTRPELEQIRGVNCALIIRNLLLRGLITEDDDKEKCMLVYAVSFDALRHLGISSTKELPEYESLHAHEHITAVVESEQENPV